MRQVLAGPGAANGGIVLTCEMRAGHGQAVAWTEGSNVKFSISISLERFDPNLDMRTVAAKALELVQIAEQGGFGIAWEREHNQIEITIAPNPLPILIPWLPHI